MEPQQYFLDQNTGISYAIVPEVSIDLYHRWEVDSGGRLRLIRFL